MTNKKNLYRNPYLIFLPYLIIFIIYVLLIPTDGAAGDQSRYLFYAKNLIQGFYSPPAPNIWLLNGPGYPTILVPFLVLKLPLISITIANAFFYYFSIILLFNALKDIVSFNATLVFSLAWASYSLAYQNMPFIHTETFTYLLVSSLIYLLVKSYAHTNQKILNKYIIFSGFIFGFIVLTKMIFGYVLTVILLGSIVLWILHRKNSNYRKTVIISLLALMTTTPYLAYTYNLTGRFFYWGMGSDSLYCMSTPYSGEYGDFKIGVSVNPIVAGNYNIPGSDSILRAHYAKDYEELDQKTGLEKDDTYKKLALQNIKSHPLKYAQNVFYNMCRLIFHYPFSYAIERPKVVMVFAVNGIIFTLMLFSLVPTIMNWRKIPIYLKFLLFITILYLGASSLVTAFVRMFTIIVPILLVWFAYIFQNTVKINLKFDKKSDEPTNQNHS